VNFTWQKIPLGTGETSNGKNLPGEFAYFGVYLWRREERDLLALA
jgi:hypothetical protein